MYLSSLSEVGSIAIKRNSTRRDSATVVSSSVSDKHIRAVLSRERRHGAVKPNSMMTPECSQAEGGGVVLDTYGDEFGHDHFGKSYSKIKDLRREVKILRALPGHDNLPHFYDAYEDHDNVYIVMELFEGVELLDRILSSDEI
ncbi:unnamed protein product [Eruca vesicaria subsp. sativa]|uniref:Protein kinase domain-containing protein n=1 Tax=Eruca vesicaria subsp. sativa TaxID=29727 RepID=A0ABC8M9Z0_ERUVS|nr:unnamed protein product [Eruca vesicaria subsp. sativa]